MGSRVSIVVGLLLVGARPTLAESFDTVGETRQGRNRFVMIGAAMVDNQGIPNGVNCLKPSGSTELRPDQLPPRARLVTATLYIAGSLFSDDGDAAGPGGELFSTPGLRADDPSQLTEVEELARAAADRSVELLLPGATAAVTVTAPVGSPFVSAFYKPDPPELGNVAFFVTPIDVTAYLAGGPLAGTYSVSGLTADVCYGVEVPCGDRPTTTSCATNPGSAIHTNSAASWALLLIVEDPELPLHSISVFDGNISLAGTSLTRNLTLANAISTPAVGTLAYYALEGDLQLPDPPLADIGPCHAEEYIEVDGDDTPALGGLCLSDDDNPVGNLFNSTINVSAAASAPSCSLPPGEEYRCCLGDGLCGVTGVDIDRFDISSALTPGADRVRVTVGSGSDRIALAVVVLGVDVFEPVLAVDSQIRVFEEVAGALLPVEHGALRLGSTVVYSIAVSNTGNVAAHDVVVRMSGPATTGGLTLVSKPAGATDVLVAGGGDAQAGLITVSGFDVPAGEIAEVRVQAYVLCGSGPRELAAEATVSCRELAAFDVAAPTVTVGGPGVGDCAGMDPHGPFEIIPEAKDLRGGAATCGGATGTGGVTPLVLGLLLALGGRRRRRTTALLVTLVTLGAIACGSRHRSPRDTEPSPKAITDLSGLAGEPCGSSGLMVWIDSAAPSARRFCIDRFEASYDGGSLGDAQQGVDDADPGLNDSTTAHATVALGALPANNVSWYQAKALCQRAGKLLCSRSDWERACRGPAALVYPYGDEMDDHACNGFFNYPARKPEVTGSLNTCGSAFGVFDLSGNLEEWVDAAVPRTPGTTPLVDRLVRGGSFKSNSNALTCFGDEFHAPPGSVDADRGFRCCSDGPVE